MIRKVALVQALREAFPEDFTGMYDSSEISEAIPPADTQPRQLPQHPTPIHLDMRN